MAIGISTYAWMWRLSKRVASRVTLEQALEGSAELGATVFQICDYEPLESFSAQQLRALRLLANRYHMTLELGTKGIDPQRLERYLQLAQELEAPLLRTMTHRNQDKPTLEQAKQRLEATMSAFIQQGITVCLETYEQVSTRDNLELVRHVNSPLFGICLDPANCIAALEMPDDVVAQTAPYVLNWHVKDFAFSRRDGWIGFTLAGCPLGEGLLRYDDIWKQVKPQTRGVNQIIEHWLPWDDDTRLLCEKEAAWTKHSMA